MSASDHINKVLFHGTRRLFNEGDIILPASKSGATENWGGLSQNKYAYATPNLDAARFFAEQAKGGDSEEHTIPRVYRVEPVNPAATFKGTNYYDPFDSVDPYDEGANTPYNETVSEHGFRVLRQVKFKKK